MSENTGSAARLRGLLILRGFQPGVPLRSTAGFTLSPAPQAGHREPATNLTRRRRPLRAAVLLHQIDRAISQLEEMCMRAIAVGQNSEAELAITIAKQERSITRHTAAMRDVAITIAHLGPP